MAPWYGREIGVDGFRAIHGDGAGFTTSASPRPTGKIITVSWRWGQCDRLSTVEGIAAGDAAVDAGGSTRDGPRPRYGDGQWVRSPESVFRTPRLRHKALNL